MYSLPDLESVSCSTSSSNCCFLTCIQISQEAGQAVWYSHLFQNFPEFIVIHTVKGFGIINKAEVDVFLKLLSFLYDPGNVGNLISHSSCFSKLAWSSGSSCHIMLKLSLQDSKHDCTSMGDECNCLIVSTFFSTTLLGNWDGD